MAGVLRDRFGQDPRYSFVAADDPVSSYDLLDSVDLVLPFTSNIGIEAAALGKTVLVAGASFYADLGFTWSATSRDEYLALLRRGLLGDLPPLARARGTGMALLLPRGRPEPDLDRLHIRPRRLLELGRAGPRRAVRRSGSCRHVGRDR